jgi:hypothetical protein
METFGSANRVFQIDLPEGCKRSFENQIYTINYEQSSAVQMSTTFYPVGKQFVLQDELEKEQKKHPTAHTTELSEYGAVHYGIDIPDEKMLQYCWITGCKNVKIFCTLTISSELENQKLDEVYAKVVDMLDTLKIFPPEISDEDMIWHNIIHQAKYFLSNAGEFFPFGVIVNDKNEIIPLGIPLGNNPESKDVLAHLERTIELKLETGEARIAGIGMDVFYKPINEAERKSAIFVKILQSNSGTKGYYLPYRRENESFVYEKPFSE